MKMKKSKFLLALIASITFLGCSNYQNFTLENNSVNALNFQKMNNASEKDRKAHVKRTIDISNVVTKALKKDSLQNAEIYLKDKYPEVDSVVVYRCASTGQKLFEIYSQNGTNLPCSDTVTQDSVTEKQREYFKTHPYRFAFAKDLKRYVTIQCLDKGK